MYEAPVKYDENSSCETQHVREDQHEFVSSTVDLIDYDSFVTEDDEPVDNVYSERQQRLLTDVLYTSWKYDRPYMACANVGIYENPPKYPIVPDMFLSLDVKPPQDVWKKKHRCYFISVIGKPPELVVEVVSNKVGNERDIKLKKYERMGVKYYIIYDPELHIFKTNLHAYQLQNGKYHAYPWRQVQKKGVWFSDLKLGLKVHRARYQGFDDEWLLWFDQNGQILLSGEEKARIASKRADAAVQKAESETERADAEAHRANTETQRADAEAHRADAEAQRADTEAKRVIAAEKQIEQERKRTEAALKELSELKAALSKK
jgi:Uma2 family endonuclease